MSSRAPFICPLCQELGRVVDSRGGGTGGFHIRRRYQCDNSDCAERWSTVERVEILKAGEPSVLAKLTKAQKLELSKLVANKLQWIAYKLRRGQM